MLLLDELTSFLDAGDQRSVLSAVRAAVDTGGVTAVWVSSWLPASTDIPVQDVVLEKPSIT